MDRDVLEALLRQLNQELQNAYLYLSMAAYFDSISLGGFAKFFKAQAKEELEHALRIYDFIVDRGGRVVLYDVPIAKKDWGSVLEAVRDFLEAERANTRRIWELVDLARSRGDKAAEAFLQWFVNEQVEEEKTAAELYSKVAMIGDNMAGLLVLDKQLSEIRE